MFFHAAHVVPCAGDMFRAPSAGRRACPSSSSWRPAPTHTGGSFAPPLNPLNTGLYAIHTSRGQNMYHNIKHVSPYQKHVSDSQDRHKHLGDQKTCLRRKNGVGPHEPTWLIGRVPVIIPPVARLRPVERRARPTSSSLRPTPSLVRATSSRAPSAERVVSDMISTWPTPTHVRAVRAPSVERRVSSASDILLSAAHTVPCAGDIVPSAKR